MEDFKAQYILHGMGECEKEDNYNIRLFNTDP